MADHPGRVGTPPTLADVAELAGVSRQTVSNAVNNPDLLRPDTLERVQQAIAQLGYLPNRAARNLRTRASHLIGMRIKPAQEGTANATMDRFVHSLVDTSREAGYHVLWSSRQIPVTEVWVASRQAVQGAGVGPAGLEALAQAADGALAEMASA